MSETNGEHIVRIGRKGRVKFQVDDAEPVVVDVVLASNEWARLDRSMRDENGRVADERILERDEMAIRFAAAHLGLQSPELSAADAYDFITRITEEVAKLEDFFTPRLPEKPESRASSTTIVTSN